MVSSADLSSFVTREEFDHRDGQIAAELGRLSGKLDELKRVTFDGVGELRKDLTGKLDELADLIEELKERSQIIELARVKKENKRLQADIEKREARGDKRINWLATIVIGFITSGVGALFHWLATKGGH